MLCALPLEPGFNSSVFSRKSSRQQTFIGDELPGRRSDAPRRTRVERRRVVDVVVVVAQEAAVEESQGGRHEQVDARRRQRTDVVDVDVKLSAQLRPPEVVQGHGNLAG